MIEDLTKIFDFSSWLVGWGFALESAINGERFLPIVRHLLYALYMFKEGEGEFWLVPPPGMKTFRVYPYPKSLPQHIIFAAKRPETISLLEIAEAGFGAEFSKNDIPSAEELEGYEKEHVCYITVSEKTLEKLSFFKDKRYLQVRKEVEKIPLFVGSDEAEIVFVARHVEKKKEKSKERPYVKDSYKKILSEELPRVLKVEFGLEPAGKAELGEDRKLYLYNCPFCGKEKGMFVWNPKEGWRFACPHCKKRGTVLHFIEYKLGLVGIDEKEKKEKLNEVIIDYFAKTQGGKQKEEPKKADQHKEEEAAQDIIEAEVIEVEETSLSGKEEKKEEKAEAQKEASEAQALKRAEEFYKKFAQLFSWERLSKEKDFVTIFRLRFEAIDRNLKRIAGNEQNISLYTFLKEFEEMNETMVAPVKASEKEKIKNVKVFAVEEKDSLGLTSVFFSALRDGRVDLREAGQVYVKDVLNYIVKAKGFPFAGVVTFPSKLYPQTGEFHFFASLKEGIKYAVKYAGALAAKQRAVVVTLEDVVSDDFYVSHSRRFLAGENLYSFIYFLKAKKGTRKTYRFVFHYPEPVQKVKEIVLALEDKNFKANVERR